MTNANTFDLPARSGPLPKTRGPAPHEQITQNAPPELQEMLLQRVLTLPAVQMGASGISVPGARAFLMDPACCGAPDAFMVGREFGHLHPHYDGSLHLRLPHEHAREVVEKGWGEKHPLTHMFAGAPILMVFGPRTQDELDVVVRIVQAAHAFAHRSSSGDSLG